VVAGFINGHCSFWGAVCFCHFGSGESPLVELIVAGGLGGLVYGGILYCRERQLVEEMLVLLKGKANK